MTSLIDRFEDIVEKHADKLAFKQEGVALTYRILNAEINRLGRQLLTYYGEINAPIAILAAGGLHQALGLLAAMKIGRVCCVLDPSNPEIRIQEMIHLFGASHILCDAANEDRAIRAGVKVLCLIGANEPVQPINESNPGINIDVNAPALVIYTSGSTGQPKGVVHSQASLLNNFMRHAEIFALSPKDRQTLLYQMNVYGGIRDCLNALLSGASLHYFPIRQLNTGALVKWLHQEKISIYCSVASVFRELLRAIPKNEVLASLRIVKSGGEATHVSDIEKFRPHLPKHARFHCGLSSSETGLACNYFIDANSVLSGSSVPLGYPADGTHVSLLDENGELIAIGSVGKIGEICIESPAVALGYWSQAGDTHQPFSGFTNHSYCRRFLSGDLGEWSEEGCLIYRGRKDQQIKIGGNRVDLTEIEARILQFASVEQVAIILLENQNRTPQLNAFVAGCSSKSMSIPLLKQELSKQLPAYMIPARFHLLEELPKTANGKIDRQKLMTLGQRQADDALNYEPPENEIERQLCDLFTKALGITKIGRRDDFFELGGDSLIAMQLLLSIDLKFGCELSRNDLWFSAPTVAEMSKLVTSNAQKSPASRWVAIPALPRIVAKRKR